MAGGILAGGAVGKEHFRQEQWDPLPSEHSRGTNAGNGGTLSLPTSPGQASRAGRCSLAA